MKKIPNIITYVIIAVSVLVTVYYVMDMSEERTGHFLTWAYFLFGLAVVLVVVLPLINLISNPKALKKAVINVGLLAVVLVIAYVFASGAQTPDTQAMATPPSATTMKITDMGLKATYLLFALALLAIISSSLLTAFKKH